MRKKERGGRGKGKGRQGWEGTFRGLGERRERGREKERGGKI